MDIFAQHFVIALKFIVPVLLIWFPFAGSWANYVLDVVDGDILQYFGMQDYQYQTIDKAADYFSYIMMVVAAWKWRIRFTVILLFVYRTIGQILFFLTRDEMMFFYFQNFLEPLIMIYSLIRFRYKGDMVKTHKTYLKHIVLIWGIILGYKLWNEWYLHFANIDLSTFFFGIDGARK